MDCQQKLYIIIYNIEYWIRMIEYWIRMEVHLYEAVMSRSKSVEKGDRV